jgi:hypothetical protein
MRHLTCCVCGGDAPAIAQWWNRDTGFGLCGRCAVWLRARPEYEPDDFQRTYGQEGIHWIATDRSASGILPSHHDD